MRLNRFISQSGVCSRRRADELIAEGVVKVNGFPVRELGSTIDPAMDTVTVAGRRVHMESTRVYILLYKPRGVITTLDDPQGRPTVGDLVDQPRRVVPVGRLDQDTSGVLLLTDDGELTHLLLHPSGELDKEYLVLLDRPLTDHELERFRNGIVVEERMTLPAEIEPVGRSRKHARYRIVLREGRNRQIRRMMEVLGAHVERLSRKSFGGLGHEGLEPGQWRFLSKKEVDQLRKAVKNVPARTAEPILEQETESDMAKPPSGRSSRPGTGSGKPASRKPASGTREGTGGSGASRSGFAGSGSSRSGATGSGSSRPTSRPTGKPASGATGRPSSRPTGKPADRSARPSERPSSKLSGRTSRPWDSNSGEARGSGARPAGRPAAEGKARDADRPVARPASRPPAASARPDKREAPAGPRGTDRGVSRPASRPPAASARPDKREAPAKPRPFAPKVEGTSASRPTRSSSFRDEPRDPDRRPKRPATPPEKGTVSPWAKTKLAEDSRKDRGPASRPRPEGETRETRPAGRSATSGRPGESRPASGRSSDARSGTGRSEGARSSTPRSGRPAPAGEGRGRRDAAPSASTGGRPTRDGAPASGAAPRSRSGEDSATGRPRAKSTGSGATGRPKTAAGAAKPKAKPKTATSKFIPAANTTPKGAVRGKYGAGPSAGSSGGRSGGKPSGRPAGKPGTRPAGKPTGKPGGGPGGKPGKDRRGG